MGKFFDSLTDHHQEFISRQHIFFVASAPLSPDGHINLSPKGMDCFRVLSPKRVAYLDVISSGNETSAHLLENGRVTFMFCALDGAPTILRLYGRGQTVLPGQPGWESLAPSFKMVPSVRQIITADIFKVQSSCGYGVPLFDYHGERDQHFKWAEKLGPEGLYEYSLANNSTSLDGLPTPFGLQNQD